MTEHKLKIIHININSIRNKRSDIKLLISEQKPDILLLQETLSKVPMNMAGMISFIHFPFSHKKARGLDILIKPNLICEPVTLDLSNALHEAIALDIHSTTHNRSIRLISYYANHAALIKKQDILNLLNSHPTTLIIGDLNARTPQSHDNPNTNGIHLQNWHNDFDLHITSPPTWTRFGYSNQRPSKLDIIITKCTNAQLITSLKVGPDVGSDHLPLIAEIQFSKLTSQPDHTPRPLFHKADWKKYENHITEQIENITPPTHTTPSIDMAIAEITTLIQTAALTSIPLSKPRPLRETLPPHIVKLIKIKRKLRRKQPKSDIDKKEINRIRNKIKHEITQHKLTKKQNIWRPNSPKDKYHFYKTANKIFKRTTKIHNSPLNYNNKSYQTDSEKAQCFKNLYEHIFSTPPHSNNHELEALERIANTRFQNNKNRIGDLRTTYRIKDISTEVTNENIDTALRKVKNTAPGHDKIHYIHIKQLPQQAKTLLAQIFEQCIALAYFPKTWKSAITILIPKPHKQHSDPNNFRPISLLPTLGKTLERIINQRITLYIEAKNIIPPTQSGFRKGRSTQDQLFRLVQDATNQLRKKQITLSCFFDLHKAYDKLWIEGFILKLNRLGLTIHTQVLLTSFLTEREVIFKVNNITSDPLNLTASTPQGAILSPLIFNLWVADIPQPAPPVQLSQFADDIATWTNTKTLAQAQQSLQTFNNQLALWCTKWKLILSPEKTQLIAFQNSKRERKSNRKSLTRKATQIINNKIITAKPTAKFLGVTLDENLKLTHHYKQIKTALQNRINIFTKITGSISKPHCPSDLNLRILKTMIIPVILYAPVVTALFTRNMFKNLDTIIRKGARKAMFCNRSTSNIYIYNKSQIDKSYGFTLFKHARNYLTHQNRAPEVKEQIKSLERTKYERNFRKLKAPSLYDVIFPGP